MDRSSFHFRSWSTDLAERHLWLTSSRQSMQIASQGRHDLHNCESTLAGLARPAAEQGLYRQAALPITKSPATWGVSTGWPISLPGS